MSSVVLLGDIHLGKGVSIGKQGIGSHLNSRVEDQLNILDWVLDQAIEIVANNIVITGDVFEDPKPHPSLITFFISWLKKCQSHSVNVHIILGNHDILRSGYFYSSSLDIISEIDLDNVSVYKNINTISIDTTSFTFLPFRDRKSLGSKSHDEAISILKNSLIYELSSIPVTYKKVLVGHLAIEGSIPVGDEIDDLSNELFCPLDMFNGYDYIWMGHVHKPQVMKKKNPYIAHTGSMDISNFGETDHKKHIIILDSLINKFETKNIPTRNLKKISIVIPKNVTDTTEYVSQFIKNMNTNFDRSIVKVEVSLSSPELQSINKSVIEDLLLKNGVFNIAGISESKKISPIKKNKNILSTKMDVVSSIKMYGDLFIDEKIRPDFIELALEIYNSYKSELK